MPQERFARTLMVQGTGSGAGKSLLVAGLVRLFTRQGLSVRPFKSQNMSLNAVVAPDGGEMAWAQALQAEAAGVPPSTDMNPILLKPKGHGLLQVILAGRAVGDHTYDSYRERVLPDARRVVAEALQRLRRQADLVIIEGAGSPVEVNLRPWDLANMAVAEMADAPVILVADIDRGGVFAQIVGTHHLLTASERARVRGVVINKFRGDVRLFSPGIRFLETETGWPVLGVLPFIPDLALPEEDSGSWVPVSRPVDPSGRDVVAIRYPRVSNFADLDPLVADGVPLRWESDPSALGQPRLVILPGSKNTMEDLDWLWRTGWAGVLRNLGADTRIMGICGGFQMLGRYLSDPFGHEGTGGFQRGLDLLPVWTRFESDKITARRQTVFLGEGSCSDLAGVSVEGYEMRTGRLEGLEPVVRLHAWEGEEGLTSAVSGDGRVVGTMLHGIMEDPKFRAHLLGGTPVASAVQGARRQRSLDRLADALGEYLDAEGLETLASVAK